MNKTRTAISDTVARIEPFDKREREDLRDIRGWVDGDQGIYRSQNPAKHIVSYFVLVDHARGSLLLMDHRKSGLWLPTGGHAEMDEDPYDTVRRELAEELGPRAQMVSSIAGMPLFATVTETRGMAPHTDVDLWYVVAGDEKMWIDPDPREFNGSRWLSFEEVLDMDIDELDPEMHRFVRKLESRLAL